MAVQAHWLHATLGYVLFASAAGACLPLHTGYTMLRLPAGLGSGMALGLLNLCNTVPTVLVAVLAAVVLPAHGYRTICMFLAALTFLSGLVLMLPQRPAPEG